MVGSRCTGLTVLDVLLVGRAPWLLGVEQALEQRGFRVGWEEASGPMPSRADVRCKLVVVDGDSVGNQRAFVLAWDACWQQTRGILWVQDARPMCRHGQLVHIRTRTAQQQMHMLAPMLLDALGPDLEAVGAFEARVSALQRRLEHDAALGDVPASSPSVPVFQTEPPEAAQGVSGERAATGYGSGGGRLTSPPTQTARSFAGAAALMGVGPNDAPPALRPRSLSSALTRQLPAQSVRRWPPRAVADEGSHAQPSLGDDGRDPQIAAGDVGSDYLR